VWSSLASFVPIKRSAHGFDEALTEILVAER